MVSSFMSKPITLEDFLKRYKVDLRVYGKYMPNVFLDERDFDIGKYRELYLLNFHNKPTGIEMGKFIVNNYNKEHSFLRIEILLGKGVLEYFNIDIDYIYKKIIYEYQLLRSLHIINKFVVEKELILNVN